jgi:hypothetical protein
MVVSTWPSSGDNWPSASEEPTIEPPRLIALVATPPTRPVAAADAKTSASRSLRFLPSR